MNDDGGEGTPYDIRAISDEVAPVDGAGGGQAVPQLLPRHRAGKTLQDLNIGGDLVLAGFMTHMCVTFTAQGAFNLGYRPTVVAEATAPRSLPTPDGTALPSAALQTAALATIIDLFGLVVPEVDALQD